MRTRIAFAYVDVLCVMLEWQARLGERDEKGEWEWAKSGER